MQDVHRPRRAFGGHQDVIMAMARNHIGADLMVRERLGDGSGQSNGVETRVNAKCDPAKPRLVRNTVFVGAVSGQDETQSLLFLYGRQRTEL